MKEERIDDDNDDDNNDEDEKNRYEDSQERPQSQSTSLPGHWINMEWQY